MAPLILLSFCLSNVFAAEPPDRTLRDIPLRDLRTMLKGYPGDWRPDTDREQGRPEPPRQKPIPRDVVRIDLPAQEEVDIGDMPLRTALRNRRSHREFAPIPLSLGELGFLLWGAQGVTSPAEPPDPPLRTAPSAGGRYPLETYVLALRVDGIPPGIFRYLPETHQLITVRAEPDLRSRVVEACYQQSFVGEAAAVIVWTAIPARTEWKYGYLAHRMIAMEAGHAGQNLYLACETAGAGACPLLGYDQGRMDALLGIDGEDEFTLYLAAVGKVGE